MMTNSQQRIYIIFGKVCIVKHIREANPLCGFHWFFGRTMSLNLAASVGQCVQEKPNILKYAQIDSSNFQPDNYVQNGAILRGLLENDTTLR